MGISSNCKYKKNNYKDNNIAHISKNNIYLEENVINKDNKFLDLICPICYNVLNDPKCCSSKKNYHYFCKQCIDAY